jgi:hypothetical protein
MHHVMHVTARQADGQHKETELIKQEFGSGHSLKCQYFLFAGTNSPTRYQISLELVLHTRLHRRAIRSQYISRLRVAIDLDPKIPIDQTVQTLKTSKNSQKLPKAITNFELQ